MTNIIIVMSLRYNHIIWKQYKYILKVCRRLSYTPEITCILRTLSAKNNMYTLILHLKNMHKIQDLTLELIMNANYFTLSQCTQISPKILNQTFLEFGPKMSQNCMYNPLYKYNLYLTHVTCTRVSKTVYNSCA